MPPKHLSGSQKHKKRKHDEEMKNSQAGAMYKFVHIPRVVENNIEEDELKEKEMEGEEHVLEQEHVEVEQEHSIEVNELVEANISEEHQMTNLIDIFDPRRWEGLNSDEIKLLVEKGPKRDASVLFGPYHIGGRRFSATLYTRTLSNMEKRDREWLVYSKEVDKIFCFCCKLFRNGAPKGKLDGEGYDDWHHAPTRVREHEVSIDHLTSMSRWFDMRKRLNLNETIDKVQYEQFKKERDYWKQILLRILALVKFLAKHNLAFRGSKEKLYEKGNGNFLGLIEMLQWFDPVIQEHVRRITKEDLHVHYLGHNIQNELILLLAQEIKKEIIKRIKEAKYYSIILDCTPDTSHQEQMSIIIRYLNFSSKSITIEESFVGFLNVKDTTGKGLFDITSEELTSLGLSIDDIRGQGYDDGANMKGKHQGMQRRFLDINPRAFYTPCACHSLNLTLCDMAQSSVKGKNFFGVIQRLYTIFANSINRWQILKDNVKDLSLKSLSQTCWESRVESVKAIRMQLPDIREALLEVNEKDNDPGVASEAKSLAEKELGEFEFYVSLVIWYELLNQVNLVSKKLQTMDMHLDIAIKEINRLIEFFKDYREDGYQKAIEEAKKIALEMNVAPIFQQRRLIRRKKRTDESSSSNEVFFDTEEAFRIEYFLFILDKGILSIEVRFEQFKTYETLFGFLFPHKLRNLEDRDLKLSCQTLANALKHEERSDIDGEELYTKLKLFHTLETCEFDNPVDVLKFLKEIDYFPNASIAYRILLTVPVTVASAERSFSKLKLLKSYLRSTMSQDRLSGLAMLAIENEILDSVDCDEVINLFALKNARRTSRILG